MLMFVHISPYCQIILLLYVNDRIITGDDPAHIQFVQAII